LAKQLDNEAKKLEIERYRSRRRAEEIAEEGLALDESERERRRAKAERRVVDRLEKNPVKLIDISIKYHFGEDAKEETR